MREKYTVINDQIGRTIVGKFVGETESTLSISNPIIIHIEPGPQGQLGLNLFPLIFFELLDKNARDQNIWTYNKSSIAISNVELNDDLIARYEQINTPPQPVVKAPNVISIDDI